MNKWWISIKQLTIYELGRMVVTNPLRFLWLYFICYNGKHLSTATIWRIK